MESCCYGVLDCYFFCLVDPSASRWFIISHSFSFSFNSSFQVSDSQSLIHFQNYAQFIIHVVLIFKALVSQEETTELIFRDKIMLRKNKHKLENTTFTTELVAQFAS